MVQFLLITVLADGSSHLRASLRGHRKLQSDRKVRPICRPGYKDVTNGEAYFWSCAFHCEGGPYYATAGCSCACQTPEQEERWVALGGFAGEIPAGSAGNRSSAGTGITLTRRPVPTRRPYVPVTSMPSGVGEPGKEWEWQPPTNGYIVQRAEQTTTSRPATENNEDLGIQLALLSAGLIVCTAIIGIVCFNWRSLMKSFKKQKQSKALTVVEPPVFDLQLPVEKCPQPAVEVSMRLSLVSTRTSASSIESRVLDMASSKVSSKVSSRVSSKQSGNGSAVRSARRDTIDLLKPPRGSQTDSATASTCSGTSSGTCSVSYCRNFLAQPPSGTPAQGRKIFLPEPACPKNNSCSSSSIRLRTGKLSKVQPVH